MAKYKTILLGYEVGTGVPVTIPLAHMVVTGQTQLSGKSTAISGLIDRARVTAVAFATKRGEAAFDCPTIPPFFQEETDWRFVESVLESVMKQKMRFERAWIVRATKGARSLSEVHENTKRLAVESKRSMDRDIYMLLDEYLDLVMPHVRDLQPRASGLRLAKNELRVMDLTQYPHAMQALVIRSTLKRVYESCEDTVSILPEAWEFVPEHRGSPVKEAAIALARKGAALRNYVWVDSQDIAGVSKELLRGASVWLLGVQREMNEVGRTLAHLPAGIKKPKPSDVTSLKLGQFWACFDGRAVKVYAQPTWIPHPSAVAIARGDGGDAQAFSRAEKSARVVAPRVEEINEVQIPKELRDVSVKRREPQKISPPAATPGMAAVEAYFKDLIAGIVRSTLADQVPLPFRRDDEHPSNGAISTPPTRSTSPADVDEDALYSRFRARLLSDEAVLLRSSS